jgi:nitroreductase
MAPGSDEPPGERYGQKIMNQPWNSFAELAGRRRSNLRIDPDRAVDPELLERLIRTAATAPNHHRTSPWRFRIITGEGRRGLGEALASDLSSDLPGGSAAAVDAAKVSKARAKYLRAPVMVAVASRAGADAVTTIENRDAVAAAIQTLLLAATDAGLASLWSTGAAVTSPSVARFCGFDPSDSILGLIYLGWPTAQLDDIHRPAPEISWIDGA